MIALLILVLIVGLVIRTHKRNRHRRDRERTVAIEILWRTTMSAPLVNTVTIVATNDVLAIVQGLQANGEASLGVVTAASWSIDNAAVATLVENTDFSATVTAVAVGTANITATATITDPDGTVLNLVGTGVITVTVNANGVRTATVEIVFTNSPSNPA